MTSITPKIAPVHCDLCHPLGFWPTTGYGLIALLVWVAVQTAAGIAALVWLGDMLNVQGADVAAAASHAVTISIAAIGSTPPAVAVIAFAARRAGCPVGDYLALAWPARRDLLLGLGIIAVLLPLGDVSSLMTGREIVPAVIVDLYKTARASGGVLLLAVALVLAAPIMEELLFRGFLFPGYAASRLSATGAIALTSVVWAAMHIQYEVFYIVQIFILGCVFGWLRWRSGSTMLTIVLHAIVNLAALLQVAFLVERAT